MGFVERLGSSEDWEGAGAQCLNFGGLWALSCLCLADFPTPPEQECKGELEKNKREVQTRGGGSQDLCQTDRSKARRGKKWVLREFPVHMFGVG